MNKLGKHILKSGLMIAIGLVVVVSYVISSNLFRQRGANLETAAIGTNARLTLVTGSSSVTLGQNRAVQVVLNTDGADITGTDVVLTWQPTQLLELTSITPNAQTSTNLKTYLPMTSSGAFDSAKVVNDANSSGRVMFSAVTADNVSGNTVGRYQGTTTLATLNFKSLQPGTASLTLNFSYRATNDSNIVVTNNTVSDILSGVSNVSLQIVPVPSNAPSPTSAPNPTTTPIPTLTPIPTHTPSPTRTPTPLPSSTPVPTATPIPTRTPTPTAVLSNRPAHKAYLSFDDPTGNRIRRSQGGILAVTTGTSIVPGKVGNGRKFSGANELINTRDQALYRRSNFTIMMWYKPETLKGYLFDDQAACERWPAVRANLRRFTIFSANNRDAKVVLSYAPPQIGVWTNLAFTYDGTSMRVFKNGDLVAGPVASAPPWDTERSLKIGAYEGVIYDPVTRSCDPLKQRKIYETLNGTLDEFYVFNHALSSTEIKAVMQAQ